MFFLITFLTSQKLQKIKKDYPYQNLTMYLLKSGSITHQNTGWDTFSLMVQQEFTLTIQLKCVLIPWDSKFFFYFRKVDYVTN